MIPVLIVVIIVVAVVAYIMVNRAANGGQKKRSVFQRNVLDDLQMNTARAIEASPDVASPLPLSRRRHIKDRRGAAVEKRFVVDWEDVDPTGSG